MLKAMFKTHFAERKIPKIIGVNLIHWPDQVPQQRKVGAKSIYSSVLLQSNTCREFEELLPSLEAREFIKSFRHL